MGSERLIYRRETVTMARRRLVVTRVTVGKDVVTARGVGQR